MSRDKALTAVFDCMVYLQAAISGTGPAAELLRHAERGNILLFVSREILQKICEVISRPEVVLKNQYLTAEFVEAFLVRVSQTASFVKAIPSHFSYLRDQKDEKYINLAVEADAEYLVSRDRDLRDLMTDYTPEVKEFRQRFRHLKIVDPVEFLRIVRAMDIALEP